MSKLPRFAATPALSRASGPFTRWYPDITRGERFVLVLQLSQLDLEMIERNYVLEMDPLQYVLTHHPLERLICLSARSESENTAFASWVMKYRQISVEFREIPRGKSGDRDAFEQLLRSIKPEERYRYLAYCRPHLDGLAPTCGFAWLTGQPFVQCLVAATHAQTAMTYANFEICLGLVVARPCFTYETGNDCLVWFKGHQTVLFTDDRWRELWLMLSGKTQRRFCVVSQSKRDLETAVACFAFSNPTLYSSYALEYHTKASRVSAHPIMYSGPFEDCHAQNSMHGMLVINPHLKKEGRHINKNSFHGRTLQKRIKQYSDLNVSSAIADRATMTDAALKKAKRLYGQDLLTLRPFPDTETGQIAEFSLQLHELLTKSPAETRSQLDIGTVYESVRSAMPLGCDISLERMADAISPSARVSRRKDTCAYGDELIKQLASIVVDRRVLPGTNLRRLLHALGCLASTLTIAQLGKDDIAAARYLGYGNRSSLYTYTKRRDELGL